MDIEYRDQNGKPLVTVNQAVESLPVTKPAVKWWIRSGYLVQTGVSDSGKPVWERKKLERVGLTREGVSLYRVSDIADAEFATRGRGGRRLSEVAA